MADATDRQCVASVLDMEKSTNACSSLPILWTNKQHHTYDHPGPRNDQQTFRIVIRVSDWCLPMQMFDLACSLRRISPKASGRLDTKICLPGLTRPGYLFLNHAWVPPENGGWTATSPSKCLTLSKSYKKRQATSRQTSFHSS